MSKNFKYQKYKHSPIKMLYFKIEEFDSPDQPGSGQNMVLLLLRKVDDLRRECGFAFIISSGYRTYRHNRNVGGVNGSAHRKGLGVDIKCRNSAQRYKLVSLALKMGFTRIGISGNYVHLDIDDSKPQNVIWTY